MALTITEYSNEQVAHSEACVAPPEDVCLGMAYKPIGSCALAVSGCGGVPNQLRRMGIRAVAWDSMHGERYDLRERVSIILIRARIRDGTMVALMMPPWCTFSLARVRTLKLRSAHHP